MNLKTFRLPILMTMAAFILSSAGFSAQAENGYWKLEKGMSTPSSDKERYKDDDREYDLTCTVSFDYWGTMTKLGTTRLTWTKLPLIVIP